MTLRELERNLVATLGLAIIAGREDDRFAELGGNAVVLVTLIQEAGGLQPLVERCRASSERTTGKGAPGCP